MTASELRAGALIAIGGGLAALVVIGIAVAIGLLAGLYAGLLVFIGLVSAIWLVISARLLGEREAVEGAQQ